MLLKKLISANGISGNEVEVRNIIQKEIKKYVDKTEVDKVGNLIAHKKGKKPCVMLAAHMDEIGLIVKWVDEKGGVYFSTIGTIEPLSLIGQRVIIGGCVRGVITTKQMTDDRTIDDLPKIDEMFVDTGLDKKELDARDIKVGSYIFFEQNSFCCLGSDNVISGKALDDRIGCYILLELAKRLKNVANEINYAFTTQEEIGLYGAKISAYEIDPDWAIVVDVTNSSAKTRMLGNGPCITVKDAEMLGNRCINDWIEKIAKKHRIPLQFEVSDGGTTDALSISLSKGGIPSSVVGVVVRNLHSTISIAHKEDINNAIKLLEILLKNPPKVCLV